MRSEELLARAADADVPEVAIRLRREAAAAREDELRHALDFVARVAEEAQGAELARLGDRLAGIFGAVLARLNGAPRLGLLDRVGQARDGR
jgi:hypothetical protein